MGDNCGVRVHPEEQEEAEGEVEWVRGVEGSMEVLWRVLRVRSATLPHFYRLIYAPGDDVRSRFVEICGEMRDSNLGIDLNSKIIWRLVITQYELAL